MNQDTPVRYLVRVGGRYAHTRYAPEQTRRVRELMRAGVCLDDVATQTGTPYSSLNYVAALEHVSRVLDGEAQRQDTPP